MVLARAARPGGEVVLEVRVAGRGAHPCEGRLRKRGAAEVRVHEHPGRVEHAAEGGSACRGHLLLEPRAQVAGVGARSDLVASAREQRSRRGDGERILAVAGELVHARKVAEPHERRV